MNIKAIRLFLHVMQRGSLAAAAEKLHMSASAASRLLTGLEHDVGLTLFSRDGHRLSPTAEGEQFYSECYRVLLAVDDLPRTARRLAGGARSRLRLISTPRYATYLVTPALDRFLRKNPDVDIELEVVLRYDSEPVYSQRPFDLGVVGIPLKHATVETTALFDLPATAILRRDHRLAGRTAIRARDLAGERIVAVEPGTGRREEMEAFFAAGGVPLRPQFTVTNLDIACQLVLSRNAVTVDDPLVPLALDADAFALVPVRPARRVHIGIVRPALKLPSITTTALEEALFEEAKAVERRFAEHSRARKRG